MSENRIRKAVIREDLLSITNDFRKAIILNQFIYWSERVSDADKFIEKENEIAKNNGKEERELFYGWIYKTAEELSEEVMLGLSASQIRRYINDLVDLGFISKRTNPNYKWDRTLQYRVNLVEIARALKKNGYPLSDYKIDIPDDDFSITHECVINNEPMENQSSSDEQAIPENTTDNTNRDYNTKNIVKYTLEDGLFTSSKGDMYTSVPEEQEVCRDKKQNRYIPEDYTEEQLIEHIYPIVVDEMDKQLDDTEYKPVDEFLEVLKCFHRKYMNETGKRHRILADISYREIVRKFLRPTEDMAMNGNSYDTDVYKDMIDKYFRIEMNKYKKKLKGDITKSFSHFMCDKVRDYIYGQLFVYGEYVKDADNDE